MSVAFICLLHTDVGHINISVAFICTVACQAHYSYVHVSGRVLVLDGVAASIRQSYVTCVHQWRSNIGRGCNSLISIHRLVPLISDSVRRSIVFVYGSRLQSTRVHDYVASMRCLYLYIGHYTSVMIIMHADHISTPVTYLLIRSHPYTVRAGPYIDRC